MITILGDFHQFFAKKMDSFVENQCNDHSYCKDGCNLSQNQQLSGEKVLKIITLVPDLYFENIKRRFCWL
jgi:hypothetical protein